MPFLGDLEREMTINPMLLMPFLGDLGAGRSSTDDLTWVWSYRRTNRGGATGGGFSTT